MTMKAQIRIVRFVLLVMVLVLFLAECGRDGGSSSAGIRLFAGVFGKFGGIGVTSRHIDTDTGTRVYAERVAAYVGGPTAGEQTNNCIAVEAGGKTRASTGVSNDVMEGPVTKVPQPDGSGGCSSPLEVLGQTVNFNGGLVFEPHASGIADVCHLTPGIVVEVHGLGALASNIEVKNSSRFELKGLISNLKSSSSPPTFMLDNLTVDYGNVVSGVTLQDGMFVTVKFISFDETTLTGQALNIDLEDDGTGGCSRSNSDAEEF